MRTLNKQEICAVAGAHSCAGTSKPKAKSPLQCFTDFVYFICQPKAPACKPKPVCEPKPRTCGSTTTPTPPVVPGDR
jgi:hypothetical protein